MRLSSRGGRRSKYSSDAGLGVHQGAGAAGPVLRGVGGGQNALATRGGGEHRSKCLLGQRTALVLTACPLPRGPRDAPLPGVLHAETVAQCDPGEGHKRRHHTSLPPGTWVGPLLVGIWARLHSVTYAP